MKKLIILLFAGLLTGGALMAQPIYVNPMQYTPTQLIQDVLITGCLQAENVVYTGHQLARGYFERTANNFAFERGVILSSGYIMNAAGPNNTGSSSQSTSGYGAGDPQLQTLISSNLNDAAKIQFDFIPHSNQLTFNYIFGSEEYPEFVGSSFNDVFGFFLTGPPCPGNAPFVNTNIATIPGTTIPVAINNVNQNVNTTYYVTNSNNAGEAIQYDGYTVPLTAQACVVPCETYFIKLAIADAGDTAYDSGVFLEGGSLSAGEVVGMTNYANGEETNEVYEGCCAYYVFYRTDTTDMSLPIDIQLNISGTASPGGDITGFPTSFQIPIGQPTDTIFYCAVMDNVTEGPEYLVFTLLNGCPCNIGGTNDTIFIYDNVQMEAGIAQNDTLICASSGVQNVQMNLSAFSNTPPEITSYQWSNGSQARNISISAPAGAITTYTVTITDECGQSAVDSVSITVSNLNTFDMDVTNILCNNICSGSVEITPLDGFAPYSYAWNPGGSGMPTIGVAENLCAGNYAVTISDAFGCTVNTNFAINQPPPLVLNFDSDSTTCEGATDGSIHVTLNYGPGNTYPVVPPYTWTCSTLQPVLGWNSNVISFQNLGAGNYTINVTDGNGCSTNGIYAVGERTLSFTSNISHVDCYGGSDGSASVAIVGGTAPFNYTWNSGETTNFINNKSAGNYSCTVIDNNDCQIIIPVSINQPQQLVFSNSLDTTMCLGETTTLTASAQGGTPPYTFQWEVNGNSIGTGAALPYTPTASSIVELTVSDANGCTQPPHTILVNLYPKVEVNLYSNEPSICAGDSTVLYVDVSGGNGGPYTVTNADGDILLPPLLVQPDATTTFEVLAYDECGSVEGIGTLEVEVQPAPPANIYADETSGCAPFLVNFFETSPDAGHSYFWQFGNDNANYSTNKNPSFTFDNAGFYDIKLTVTSELGCSRTVQKSDFIEVLPQPVLSIMPDPPVTSSLSPVIAFFNTSERPLTDATIYFGDGNSLELTSTQFPEIQYTYKDTGIFSAYLIGKNDQGCIDTVYTKVEIYAEHQQIFVPNVINPLSQFSENRVFLPIGFAIDENEFHLIIYNRWGNKVFESFDANRGWDGRLSNGDLAKSDTYQWVLIYKDNRGKTLREAGNVSVIY
mgnify:CR=1 FL=1